MICLSRVRDFCAIQSNASGIYHQKSLENIAAMPIPESSLCYEFKSGNIELYNSDVKFTAFKPILPLTKAIRISLKRSSKGGRIVASCFVDNLEQIGLTVKAVMFSYTRLYQGQNIVEVKRAGQGNRKSLFCTAFEVSWADRVVQFSCIFRIYVTGSVEQYNHLRFDRLFGDQMWKAAVEQKMTDVDFVVRDRKFFAHKFILAARSPVFQSMFKGGYNEHVQISYVHPRVFQQFLQFLYTGQLSGPIIGTASLPPSGAQRSSH